MKTAAEYVRLAEAELDLGQRGTGGDGDRAVARAAVYAALADVALRQPLDVALGQTVHYCPNHAPTQHRDGKPKWCNACGRTTSGIHHDDLPRAAGRPGGARP